MNQEQAKAWLPLIQAVAEGKTLQTKVFRWVEDQLVVDWVSVYGDVDFLTAPSRWRIKPEPKKGWYRNYVCKNGDVEVITKLNFNDQEKAEAVFSHKSAQFSHWIGDRIEYELPEGEV